jgi:6-phosphogluconate dehydrogenase
MECLSCGVYQDLASRLHHSVRCVHQLQSRVSRLDAIADFLAPLLKRDTKAHNLMLIPEIGQELSKTYDSLKKVAMLLVETDAVAPAVSATLEWMKAIGARDLPTDFEEMELDCEGTRLSR